jgi:phage terminase large subunit-like protein
MVLEVSTYLPFDRFSFPDPFVNVGITPTARWAITILFDPMRQIERVRRRVEFPFGVLQR